MPLDTGQPAPDFQTQDYLGQPLRLADFRGRKVMLAFFRFATCPYCNLRVMELTAKAASYQDHLQIIAVFQSPAETLQRHRNMQSFPGRMIGDPDKRLFELYQGERSAAKFVIGHLLHPADWVRGVQQGAFDTGRTAGDLLLVPADILIDESGIIQKAHYGRDVTDHLPLSEITRFARGSGKLETREINRLF
jgi:thioredoxin-dependent peroxiredoxin